MGSVQVMTVCRCCSRAEEVEVESDKEGEGSGGTLPTRGGYNPIVNQLPVIENEKTESNKTFATAIPYHPTRK